MSINQYHNIIDINENNYDANFMLGRLYSRNRRYELSTKYYLKAVDIYNDCHSSLNNIGYNLFKLGEYEKAIEYYDKAIALDAEEKIYINNKKNALKEIKKKTVLNNAQKYEALNRG